MPTPTPTPGGDGGGVAAAVIAEMKGFLTPGNGTGTPPRAAIPLVVLRAVRAKRVVSAVPAVISLVTVFGLLGIPPRSVALRGLVVVR